MGDKAPLTGYEVHSSRLSSGETVQKLEMAMFVLLSLLAVAAAVVGFVYSGTHPEHMMSAISCIFNFALLLVVGYFYRRDEIQDRRVVYLVALCSFLSSVTAIVYAAQWKSGDSCPTAAPAAWPCPAGTYYSDTTKMCLSIDRTTYPCFLMTNTSTTQRLQTLGAPPYIVVAPSKYFGPAQARALWSACYQSQGVAYNISG